MFCRLLLFPLCTNKYSNFLVVFVFAFLFFLFTLESARAGSALTFGRPNSLYRGPLTAPVRSQTTTATWSLPYISVMLSHMVAAIQTQQLTSIAMTNLTRPATKAVVVNTATTE